MELKLKLVSSITLNENENFNDKIGAGKKTQITTYFFNYFQN